MKDSQPFRRHLLARVLLAAGLATSASGACSGGSSTNDDDGGGGNATTQTTTTDTWTGEECFAWPQPLTGGAGGVGGAGGNASVGGAGGTATVGGAGGVGGTALPPCPEGAEALALVMQQSVCAQSISEGPTLAMGGNGPECCYQVTQGGCVTGRPYLADGAARHAAPRWGNDDDWRDGRCPDVNALDAATRSALAAAWCADGLMEHASVASFGRFALELLAVGAPADLVAGAHRAALDEVIHARACLQLASAYAGEPVSPGTFPFEDRVQVSSSLADIAARAVIEGCVGETLAAAQAAEQRVHARDAAVCEVLETIARDEARHAELAWATVAWALRVGGEPVRCAVERAFEESIHAAACDGSGAVEGNDAALRAHGRLDGSQLRALRRHALRDVVIPCAQRLLAQITPSHDAPAGV